MTSYPVAFLVWRNIRSAILDDDIERHSHQTKHRKRMKAVSNNALEINRAQVCEQWMTQFGESDALCHHPRWRTGYCAIPKKKATGYEIIQDGHRK